ncbi:MAG: hypothetical protein R6X35_06445 [Candidatus Krumholzibacteriia bacterium]
MKSLLVRIVGGAGSGARAALSATALAVLALGAGPAAAFNETGGSGLLTTEQAYSLPIGRPLFSIHSGFYSNNFTPGTSRLLTMTPSATMGLGGGFEAAAALPFEGLSSSLDAGGFTRRVDFRRSGLLTKLRWTTDIGSPRLRGGVMGHLTLPLGSGDRPGATVDPSNDHDIGLMALLSTNLGWFDFPLRVFLNLGYWWSRDDGAFVYRSLPTAIPVGGVAADRNDVLEYTVAFEAGLRRAVVFLELHSEQFVDARDALSAKENLWQLTPGFRTQLTSSVGLTGGVTFDVSSDDGGTAFDTGASYPDYELKLGLTLGSVLGRNRHEESRRDRGRTEAAFAAAEASRPAPAPAAKTPDRVPARVSEPVAPALPPAPPATADALRIRELEERLARVETAQKLTALEARLASLEGRPAPGAAAPAPVKTAVPTTKAAPTPAPVPAPADTLAAVTPVPAAASVTPSTELPAPAAAAPVPPQVQNQLDDLQRELQLLKDAGSTPAAPVAAAAPDSAAAMAAPPAKAADVADPASVTAPAVAPELQAQLDNLQGGLQRLLDQQAARDRAAAAPPAAVAVPDRDRSTVIFGDGAAASPPVVAVQPTPAPAPAPQPAPEALDPALQQPYQSEATTTKAQEPAAPATVAAGPAPAAAPPFGLEVGQRRSLAAIDVTAVSPLAGAAATAELDALAGTLAAKPTAGIALLVHGGGADRAAALATTGELAVLVRDYLVAAGAPSHNIVPIGMGHSEGGAPRVEIERIR